MNALYHRIYKRENFETAANDLIGLIYMAQEKVPDEPRALYVDIEGHRDENGAFDEDMRELQTEFGLGVLLQYVEEVHFPMVSAKNSKGQCNDVPQKIVIGNQKNERDITLDKLYIENFSNTEFMSEEDVYQFMEKVSEFLKEYTHSAKYSYKNEEFDSFGWLGLWHNHMLDLSTELFNSFVYGNLLSVAAMTRSLMECYIFVRIIKLAKSPELIDEWWLCNTIHKVNESEANGETLKEAIKKYCCAKNINFEEKWQYYTKYAKGEKGWLRTFMGDKGLGTSALCTYIEEPEIYNDYQKTSAFVHGQDLITKLSPFTFYSSIYGHLYLMIHYIFKAIRLFQVDEDIEEEMQELEDALYELGDRYFG